MKIKMSKLALGTAQFGLNYGIANQTGQITFPVAKDIIKLAKEKNIDTIDTAISYGESEAVIGQIGVSNFNVVSKLPDISNKDSDIEQWIEKKVELSLERLKIKSLYGLLIHQTQNLLNNDKKLIDTLNKLKSLGLIKKIGISIYDPSELDPILDIMKIDIVQAPLNIIDRRLETSGWLSKLYKNDIEVHTRSTFLQGLLLMPRSNIPPKFDQWSGIWDKWTNELKKNHLDPCIECLSYPLSLPEVSRVVVGVDNFEQFEKIICLQKFKLQKKDWSFMKSLDPKLINPFNW